MYTSQYSSLPEAKSLLNHLHKINPKYGIEIIFPKKKWLGEDLTQNDESMAIINNHHEVFKDSSGNDFGLKFICRESNDFFIFVQNMNPKICGRTRTKNKF